MGVSQSIADGYMGRCEMVWTTAGTNRVCGRCLELKDRVVGYTDESGVTLPPLHPRCRCAIMYREVGAPRVMQPKPKPSGGRNYDNELARTIGRDHYIALREVIEKSPHTKAKTVWNAFEDKIKIEVINAGEAAYQDGNKIFINLFENLTGDALNLPYQSVVHESVHLIDYLVKNGYLSVEFKNQAFYNAIKEDLEALIDAKLNEIFVAPKNPRSKVKTLLQAKHWKTLKEFGYISNREWLDLSFAWSRKKAKADILARFENSSDEEIIKMLRLTKRLDAVDKICDEMTKNFPKMDRACLSDIFNGYLYVVSGEEFDFGAMHEASYWLYGKAKTVAMEALAHFSESALVNQGSWAVLNKFLPRASKVFEELLDEILDEVS